MSKLDRDGFVDGNSLPIGVVKGYHGRFVGTKTILERFNEKVAQGPGCRNWMGMRIYSGYGQMHISGRHHQASRVAYELYRGPIPQGMEIDHLCRNRACCNPDHLEIVTHKENTLRGNSVSAIAARKTHCPYGHPYAGENLYQNRHGHRKCNTCRRIKQAEKAKERGYWKKPTAIRAGKEGGG